ncbi:hypothetical protein Bca52824_055209 [Brassica carinata]|uniref:Uncharacterized protein n=1 Tax=Brassica carinata TaxID=52824 RepID=A0A8X7REU7_BRACI|nr:hypothetical protein Bca52824_055209 [Brassica carinata]
MSIPGFELKVDEFEAYLKDGGSILIIKRGKYIYEAFLHSQIVLSAFDGSPLAALAILKKKICDHPLLSTKRAAEDVLEGMESTLTPEEAGVAERLAMHIAQENLIPSVDRAYRTGQTKDVIVYRLMTSATVEENIYRKQDLRELFSLPKGGFDVSPTQQQLYEEHYNQIKLDEFLESHVKFLETLEIQALVVERVAVNSFTDLYGLRASCKMMKALAEQSRVNHFYDVLSVPRRLNMPPELFKTCYAERNPSMKSVQFFFTFNLQEEGLAFMKLAADERYERAVYTYAMTRKIFWG